MKKSNINNNENIILDEIKKVNRNLQRIGKILYYLYNDKSTGINSPGILSIIKELE